MTGPDTEASRAQLARLAANKVEDPAALLAKLAGVPRQTHAHRPRELSRGDISREEWDGLLWLHERIERMISDQHRLNHLAYSIYYLVEQLTRHGYVRTNEALTGIMAARGYGQDVVEAFEGAIALIWSMAGMHGFQVGQSLAVQVEQAIPHEEPESPTP